MLPTLQPITVPAAKEPCRSALIMLHGRGDSGRGWVDIAQMLTQHLPHTRFIFPTAPVRQITKLGGARMPAWFDNPSAPVGGMARQAVVPDGILDSKRYVEGLLQELAAGGLPSSRVVVGGFSQGAAMSLLLLRSQHQLAGVVALSGYLPMRHEPILSEANRGTPALVCHGTTDQMIPYEQAVQAAQALQEAGANFELKTYAGMGHQAWADELDDVRQFLVQCLA